MRSGDWLKILCVAYAVFLTALLLVANPNAMIGSPRGTLKTLLDHLLPAAHLLSFCVLTVLVLVARWPLPRWFLIALLIIYGGTTEIAQSFLPPRTPDWNDWFQDVGGVLAGIGCYWGLHALTKRLRQTPS
jgi:VanZ family protein